MKSQIGPSPAVSTAALADAFWHMTCLAFCTGLAVSVVAGGVVLLIAGLGSA